MKKYNKKIMAGWRGHPEIEMVSHGSWGDPDLVWGDYTFNYWDIEDALWNMFCEDMGYEDSDSENPAVERQFNKYVLQMAVPYLEDVIAGGYFDKGSYDWHDKYNR